MVCPLVDSQEKEFVSFLEPFLNGGRIRVSHGIDRDPITVLGFPYRSPFFLCLCSDTRSKSEMRQRIHRDTIPQKDVPEELILRQMREKNP